MGVPVLKVVRAEDPEIVRTQVPYSATRLRPLLSENAVALGTNASTSATCDAELVQALLDGDRQALEHLYKRHADFAFCLAVRLQGHSQDVEDVVHDAFLKANTSLASLHDKNAFRGWLGSIVVNEVRIRLRKTKFLRVLRLQGAEPVDLDSLASPAAGPEVRAQLAQVYGLLRLMVTEERIAWTLRFVEHHQLDEVAELCGCSLATVKRRLQGAQRFLEDHLVTDRRLGDAPSGRRGVEEGTQ